MPQEIFPARPVRQRGRGQRRDTPQGAWAVAIEREHPRMRDVAVVTAEQLIAAVSGKDDRNVPPCNLRDVPRRDRGRIGERLVEVRHEIVENALSQITLAQLVGDESSVDAMFHSIQGIHRTIEPQRI